MTFSSPTERLKRTTTDSITHLPVTQTEQKMAPGADKTKPNHKNMLKEKKNTESSFLKAYSQQHEPRGQRTNIKQ